MTVVNFDDRYKRVAFMRDIIKKLVDRRRKMGITQDELNYKIGVADRLLSKWECGDRSPTSFNFFCWAQALGLEIDFKELDKKAANDNNPPCENCINQN